MENSRRVVRLVYVNENGRLEMDKEAIDALQQLKGPVAVVSICGPARQGKSFLFNQLFCNHAGFQAASTHQPCTKGLWMWSAPWKSYAPDGTECNLLLVDSEGMDANNQAGAYSAKIFSLVTLLSSMFIYNQMGGIDEAALDRLSLVTEIKKYIHARAAGDDAMSELEQLSPTFVWLLRDFSLDSMEDNARVTSRDYLELALRSIPGSEQEIAAKNKIRESIRALFPLRECFTLVHPFHGETDLQHLDQIPLEKLRPEFRSELHAFAKFIYDTAKPKQVGGAFMTGPMLAGITESFVNSLNNGAVPLISSYWQDGKSKAFMEADLRCSTAIEGVEKKLQAALRAPDAKVDDMIMAVDSLFVEYEASIHAPTKWQKLSSFLKKSLQDVILHRGNTHLDKVLSDNKNLMLKCRSMEDTIGLLKKQLEVSDRFKNEYQKHYEDAIDDMKKVSDHYKSRISELESKCRSSEEKCSSLMETLEPTRLEALGWKRKYEEILVEKNASDAWANVEISILKSKGSAAEAGAVAAREQAWSAQEEAKKWKIKHDLAVSEKNTVVEKAKAMEESLKQAQIREEALKAEFSSSMEVQEKEIKDRTRKLASAGQQVAALSLELKNAESKMESCNLESSNLRFRLRELDEKYCCAIAAVESLEREAQTLRQEKTQLEEKYIHQLESYKAAQMEIINSNQLADSFRAEVFAARSRESELQRLAQEKCAETERMKSYIENLEKQKNDLVGEVQKCHLEKEDAISNLASLEARLNGEIEALKMKCSLQLNSGESDFNNVHEASNSKTPNGKRSWLEAAEASFGSVQAMEIEEDIASEKKRPKSNITPRKCTMTEAGISSLHKAIEGECGSPKVAVSASYTKLTVAKLRQELTRHGLGAELLRLKSPKKKDLLNLYEKHLLHK